jgi:hypothetical protein
MKRQYPTEAVAGYSKTSQAKKLGIKPASSVGLEHAPVGWALVDAPEDIVYVLAPEPADVIICFCTAAAQLSPRLPNLAERIFPDGSLWLAWPRRAAGHASDITGDIIRAHALKFSIVDVKVAAIDDDWSGQRYVWCKENRTRS